MDRKKKASILLSCLFVLSLFLIVSVIPPTPFSTTLPGSSIYSSAIVAKADPNSPNYAYWWDTSYGYRQEIVFNNTASPYAIVNSPVDVFMSFASGKCHNGTIRVQYWNSTNLTWSPGDSDGIPYQIWNDTYYPSTTYYSSFTITFYVNVPAYSTASYFVYYDNNTGTTPSFPSQVSYSGTTGNWTFQGQYYQAYVNTSLNGGKIYTSYNNVSGSNQWAYDNQFHWDTEYIINIIVTKGVKQWDDTWIYDTSTHSANSTPVLQQQGPLFIMLSTVSNLTLTSGGTQVPSQYVPTNAGYANVTYRFFSWGWITETNTTITQNFTFGGSGQNIQGGKKLILQSGSLICNSWKFNPYLGTLAYKYGTTVTTLDSFTGQQSIGAPYWFTLYNSTNGQAVGAVDLMIPTLDGSQNRNWNYLVSGTSYNPEQWQRILTANLTINDYVKEKYALYVWNASGGSPCLPFENFADGVSVLERESAPLTVSVGAEENIHYTVNVYVTDHDGSSLANANVTVYSGSTYVGSKITNSSGYATFYLENGNYNFNATWNGTTSYESYKNSTTSTINATTTINLIFNNITTLRCRTQYDAPDYNPIQNAYVTINTTSGNLVDQSNVNLTGYAEFHINRSSVFSTNYTIKAFWQNGTALPSNENYPNMYIDNNSYSISPLNFTVPLASNLIYTYIIANATTTNSTWGTNVILQVNWRDNASNNLDTNDSSVGGYVNWTLNFINGSHVAGPTTLIPQGTAPNVYYLINVSSSLLIGGLQYQVYINAIAANSTYLPAANQTVISVQLATLGVQLNPLTGPYYWKHSDITLWAYITDNASKPITTATVPFSIIGTNVSGTLTPSSPSGNYTYTIPASVVGSSLNAATYGLRFTVSNTNYTSNESITQLVITPAETEFLYSSLVIGYYGNLLPISVIYRDALDKTTISEGTVSYFVVNQDVYSNLVPSGQGNWTGNFNSTLLYPGYYVLKLTAYSPNYESHTDYIPLVIQSVPIEIESANIISSAVYQNLSISVNIIDTLYSENVTNATALYFIRDSNGSPVVSGLLNEDPINNGTYHNWLILKPDLTPPGNYIIEVSAFKENYTTSEKIIQLAVKGVPTVLSASSLYFSDLNAPAVFFFGNFGQTESSIPFPAIFIFRFADSDGSAIPNASISAGGWPLISLGGGYYAVVVPTSGLPPGTYPIVVSASAYLYEPQQSFFILQVKETSVQIPLSNTRVPLTTFVAVIFSVAIPVSVFLTYTFVKRVRIPAIIRRIDQLIVAMNRGVKVDVSPVPRESVLSRVLTEELGIVGVEPIVEAYVPVELSDRLASLLVESGMAEKEAKALAIELKKATPAEREKLLESVGISGETSARVMQTIEKYEEMPKVPLHKQVKPVKPIKPKKETTGAPQEGAQSEEPHEETQETPSPESAEPVKPKEENDENSREPDD